MQGGWWFGRNDSGATGIFPSNYVKEFVVNQLPTARIAIPPDNSGVFRVNDIIRIVHVYDNGFCIIFSDSFQACKITPRSNLSQGQSVQYQQQQPNYPPSPVQYSNYQQQQYQQPNSFPRTNSGGKPLPQTPPVSRTVQSSYNSSPNLRQQNNYPPQTQKQQYYSPSVQRNQYPGSSSTYSQKKPAPTVSPWQSQYPASPPVVKKPPELSAREIERNERIREQQRKQQAIEFEKQKAANAQRELQDLELARQQRIQQDLLKADHKRKARELEQKQRWDSLEQQRKFEEAETVRGQLEREEEFNRKQEEIRLEKERKQREKEEEEQRMIIAKEKALQEIEEYRRNEFEYYKKIREEKAREEEERERLEDAKWEQELEKREQRKKEREEWDALIFDCKDKKKRKKKKDSDSDEELIIMESKVQGLMDDMQNLL